MDDQLPGAAEFRKRRSRRALLEPVTPIKVHASDGVMKLRGPTGGKMTGCGKLNSVAGRVFRTEAIGDAIFGPLEINTSYKTLKMTLWLESAWRITHYITFT